MIYYQVALKFLKANSKKYASYYEQPDICKYLIGKGVDLDCLERIFLGPGLM